MTEVYIYSISQYYLLLHKFKSLWLYIFIQICDWFLNEFNRFIINIRLDCALNCQNLFICWLLYAAINWEEILGFSWHDWKRTFETWMQRTKSWRRCSAMSAVTTRTCKCILQQYCNSNRTNALRARNKRYVIINNYSILLTSLIAHFKLLQQQQEYFYNNTWNQ